MEFSYEQVYKFFSDVHLKKKVQILSDCISFVEKIVGCKLSESSKNQVKNKFDSQLRKFKELFETSHRTMKDVEKRCSNSWKETLIVIPKEWFISPKTLEPSSSNYRKVGRPKKPLNTLKLSSSYNVAAQLAKEAEFNPVILLRALKYVASRHREQNSGFCQIISKAITNIEQINDYHLVKKTDEKMNRLSALESYGIIIDNSMSKATYLSLRMKLKAKGADLLPAYEHILHIKQECRPNSITVEDERAFTTVLSLSIHTITRIVKSEEKLIVDYFLANNLNILEAEIIFSYGGDGCTSIPQFHQLDD